MSAQDVFKFHLFVSYTRTPDGALAREIERFLESFDKTPLRDKTVRLSPLQVCLDGSDFSLPPPGPAVSDEEHRSVLSVVYQHLAQSREMLVLCSAHAAVSNWVEKEIRWFLEHRGPRAIRVAFTDGPQPWTEPAGYFPPPVIEHALHEGIAYDLRGYDARRSRHWTQVPGFQREMVRLAADLLGLSGGDLYPSWLEAELERTRRQSLTLASTARFETLAGDPSRALLTAFEAHELHPGETTEIALREAYKVAVLHHHNRREISRISGSGPGYLAARWQQGNVFTKSSPDGKYRLLVTKRGKDGPTPPGDVYLISNETLRAVKLGPREGNGGRVEEVAFDRASRHVFVTRYYNLEVYASDGRCIGGYEFSRHTKSPVHLVNGYFAGRYILGAETKGGVWLVDVERGPDATLTVLPEFHGDATIFTDISPDGKRAALIFESGRGALLTLEPDGKPRLADLAARGLLFAGFAAGRADILVSSGDDGSVVLSDLEDGSPRESGRIKLPAPVDWVSADAGLVRLAAVGADRKLYIIDRANSELLATLDYADSIDWTSVRGVAVPERLAEPGVAENFGPAEPFPPLELPVSNVQVIDGITWIFTEDWPAGAYTPNRAVYRLDGAEMRNLPAIHAEFAEKHGDLLWMRVGAEYGGPAFRHRDGCLRRFPTKDLEVSCMHENGDVVLVGTRAGAYRHAATDSRLVTPQDLDVRSIEEVGGRIWIRSAQGAYLFENDRLVPVGDPFLEVRAIKEVNGEVWLLTKTQAVFDSDGPSYRVDGHFASPLSGATKVSDVLPAGGASWVAEPDRVHRVVGDDTRAIAGLEGNVDGIVQAGRTMWLTTQMRGMWSAWRRRAYRMDAEALAPERLEIDGEFLRAAGRAWLKYLRDGRWRLAEPREDGLREIDFGDASPTQVVAHDDEPWFLTTAGAYRSAGGSIKPVDAPNLAYHALVGLDGELWLLSSGAGVRLHDAGAVAFSTGGHKPTAVRRVAGRTWLLTCTADNHPGPAYRIGREGAEPIAPPSGGVGDVIAIDGEAWLLTKKEGKAGPLVACG